MGAFSPIPAVGDDLVGQILETIVEPTVSWLLRNDIDYRGVLYAGLMLTPAGPKAIEYNIRFGDPEAQVVLPRIASDLTALLAEAAQGRIRSPVAFSRDAAVTVVCATEGYPLSQRSGDVIEGLDRLRDAADVHVYFAGVAEDGDRRLVTSGGRVLDVTSRGDDVADARRRAYEAVSKISWPGMVFRRDVAADVTV
jgi:phosphoribosylamine--glycine ligase